MKVLKKHLETSKNGFATLKKVIEFSCSSCGLFVSLCSTEALKRRKTPQHLLGNSTTSGFAIGDVPKAFFTLSTIKRRYFGEKRSEDEKRIVRCVDHFTFRSLTDVIFD